MGDVTDEGVADMVGNVSELVDGWYDALYYRRAEEQDPRGPDRAGMGNYVPIRGGNFSDSAAFSTITYRGFRHLVNQRSGRRNIGFRCVHPSGE
jgi:formylglycine-generating enzyme required for sulfatase activity